MSVLKTKDIRKVYPGTIALNDVTVEFESGKVHALIGKNGSGKSTLLKIFSGAVSPTSGNVYLDNANLSFDNPRDALEQGIATVYQELSLVPGLSVAENILLGRLPMKGKLVDWKKTYSMAAELLQEFDVMISPKEMVYNLSVGQAQMIEIIKAMSFKPKVLQLDEPTSALAKAEIQSLFKMINKLKEKNVIIIYVSHRLHELWEIADTSTVIRDGVYIGTLNMKDASRKEILHMMFGDVIIPKRPLDLMIEEKIILEVKNLTRKGKFTNINFKLRKGEILGIAGMLGSGRTELLKSIFGAESYDSGDIYFENKKVKSPTPQKMKKLGLALTPEDRKHEGLVQIASVKSNLCMASLNKLGKGLIVNRQLENECVRRQINDLQIKVSNSENLVSSLSGGNQQKVVIGNWLNNEPKIILFDEPSRGIDVNAKQQIFQIIWEQSRSGISSIMVSSELEELIEVCHRVLIIKDGVITGEIMPDEVEVQKLYELCIGGI